MKVYKLKNAIIVTNGKSHALLKNFNWDDFINDDRLFEKCKEILTLEQYSTEGTRLLTERLHPPIESQEIWASGVTYFRSKEGRQEESKESGGSDFYEKVYEAERPELFFKANGYKAVGPNENVRIREDSNWNVPEPELTLVITSNGKIVGYTIGNDMSSRSIEGENPLYLPQAKVYDGSAAIGPCVFVTNTPLSMDTKISLEIVRDRSVVFSDSIAINQIKRSLEELVEYLFKEYSFRHGCYLMTGTGIVPPSAFTLQSKDQINISIDRIGTLSNTVA